MFYRERTTCAPVFPIMQQSAEHLQKHRRIPTHPNTKRPTVSSQLSLKYLLLCCTEVYRPAFGLFIQNLTFHESKVHFYVWILLFCLWRCSCSSVPRLLRFQTQSVPDNLNCQETLKWHLLECILWSMWLPTV